MTTLSKGFNPRRGLNPIKTLGQHFLREAKIIDDLITASDPNSNDVYLEIGAGEGAVTKNLAPRVKKLIAVEIDKQLLETLESNTKGINNVLVVNQNALAYLNLRYHDSNFNKVIGSIPYQITSPLLHSLAKWCANNREVDSVVLLIQKEVADKITAGAPHGSYLSNFVQTYFDVTYIKTVPKSSFWPVPKVDGAIVRLQPKTTNYQLLTTNSTKWSAFLHQGFKFPRKMLKKVFDERILEQAGIDPDQRPQEVSLDSWSKLYKLYGREKL